MATHVVVPPSIKSDTAYQILTGGSRPGPVSYGDVCGELDVNGVSRGPGGDLLGPLLHDGAGGDDLIR